MEHPPQSPNKIWMWIIVPRKCQTPYNFELHTKHVFVNNIELNTFLYAKNYGIWMNEMGQIFCIDFHLDFSKYDSYKNWVCFACFVLG